MADKIFSVADGLHDELPSVKTAKAGRMLITTDKGEMYYEPEDEKRIQINPQADWSQNDETANDYIKNKPYTNVSEIKITLDNMTDFSDETVYVASKDILVQYAVKPSEETEDPGFGEIIIGGTGVGTPDHNFNSANVLIKKGSIIKFSKFSGSGNKMLTMHVFGSIVKSRKNVGSNSIAENYQNYIGRFRNCTSPSYETPSGEIVPSEIYVDYEQVALFNNTNNGNIKNGSAIGSLRTIGSKEENDSYKLGKYAFAEGNNTKASGESSHAEGLDTTASGLHSSHAEGIGTTASGESSHAEGAGTTASGSYSHAEGWDTKASGNASHAEGYNTTASVYFSHAEGLNTTASGYASHAEGDTTKALGYASHAEGKGTEAKKDYSHAEGNNTKASSEYQHVQGQYNIEDSSNTYADIIGNGFFNDPTNTKRSNAATVDWQGNAWYAGDVYVGSTSGTNRDEGSKKLATEIYTNTVLANALKDSVSGLNVVQITDKNNILCPVTHEMGVKIRGKNLFDVDMSFTDDNKVTDGAATGYLTYFIQLQPNTKYYAKCFNPITTDITVTILSSNKAVNSDVNKAILLSKQLTGWKTELVLTTDDTGRLYVGNNANALNKIKEILSACNLQLELSTTPTDYTPYVSDLTAVKVSRCGKNFFDKTSVLDTNNWVNYQAGYRNYHITGLKPNTEYTFSMSANNWVGVSNNSFYMSINTVQSIYSAYPIVHNNGVATYNPKKQTITSSNNGDLYLQFYNVTTERLATCFNGLIDLQLEIGSARTNYEPYKTPTDYTPTADGVVNGVTSLYPNTTLMTDTEGIYIDCEYNVDLNSTLGNINTALDSIIEIQNSLIGGNR